MKIVGGNGVLTLSAMVRNTWALHTWILGHAEHINILQPVHLRAALAKRIRAAAGQYA